MANKKRDWKGLLKSLGFPENPREIDNAIQCARRSMNIGDFAELMEISEEAPFPITEGTFLAGGAVLGWVTGQPYGDLDYFGRSLTDCETVCSALMEHGYEYNSYQGEQELIEQWNDGPWNPSFPIRDWYVDRWGLSDDGSVHREIMDTEADKTDWVRALNFTRSKARPAQVVLFQRGCPEEIVSTFDLSVCEWAIDRENVYWGAYAVQDTARRIVRLDTIHHPYSTWRRVAKYMNKGYGVSNDVLLKISDAVSNYANSRIMADLPPTPRHSTGLHSSSYSNSSYRNGD